MTGDRTQTLAAEILLHARDQASLLLTPERAGQVHHLIDQVFRNVPPEDLLGWTGRQVYAAAQSLWQLANQRKPGESLVRAFNPTVEDEGWHTRHSVVEIVTDDMPFLVDSITAAITALGLTVHLVIHPILWMRRDGEGRLQALATEKGEGTLRESVMHVQIDRQSDQGRLDAVEAAVETALKDVRQAVADWLPMRGRIHDAIAEVKNAPAAYVGRISLEATEFLRWLQNDHFTFLGYRYYNAVPEGDLLRLVPEESSGLGLLRDPGFRVFGGLRSQTQADVIGARALLIVTKSSQISTVHRRVQMDVIGIRRFDARGLLLGEHLFLGLFTAAAYARAATDIPYLAGKVDRVLAASGVDPQTHDGKKLAHILNSYPRDELFQIDEETLLKTARGILNLQDRQRTALFLRVDPLQRQVTALVYVPRDRYDTRLRQRVQQILEAALAGACTQFYTNLDDAPLARVLFRIETTPGSLPAFDPDVLEAKIRDIARSWEDRLSAAAIEAHGEERARMLLSRYGAAFPAGYVERVDAHTALFDILQLERLEQSGQLQMNLFRPVDAAPDQLNFKLYTLDRPLVLAEILPTLANLGLKPISEVPTTIELPPEKEGAPQRVAILHDFTAQVAPGVTERLDQIKTPFHSAVRAVLDGRAEDDRLNALVMAGAMPWPDVVILRAIARYLRQTRLPFAFDTLAEILVRHAPIAAGLAKLFHLRLKPDLTGDRAALIQHQEARLTADLRDVANLSDDLVLRRFLAVIQAVLRTNAYLGGSPGIGRHVLAMKIDSARVPELPAPRPWREIWIYAPRVEGIHLRGGPVARGGIRWSDRRDDFRTEVLGLVKAQMVKNAVIVPTGAKGGFVLKRPPAGNDRDRMLAEGIACYKAFIGGLLDVTDSLKDGRIVPPADVLRHDGDDPYLVVAADKGTATFSDIANAIAVERNFWLSDGFASGGSSGYDHKKMGITARGAWVAVTRHFQERGIDVQSDPVSVIGVGDMSGDVFGNGLLQSRSLRLIAAFDHRHIFLDPNPDPEKSHAERQRLFDLPRSSWADYDRSLISAGGGVIPRSQKSIALGEQAAAALGCAAGDYSPDQLLALILKAPADLLFFGGIGTFVKAEDESHEQVGDKANDPVRIDARDLRCKVIGEGANLGMTQAARVEAALAGIGLNTDFIDNAAGVSTSDHEVNIKILLAPIVARGALTLPERDQLLASMTDEVAALVLTDMFRQTGAVSLEQARAKALLGDQLRLIRGLTAAGRLNPALEGLPDDEAIAARRRRDLGLTRPEIAVLVSYAKNDLFRALVESDAPDAPAMQAELQAYFPKVLVERFASDLDRHPLRREIIATSLANQLVDRLGTSFVHRLTNRVGCTAGDVARAYVATRDAFGIRQLWAELDEQIGQVPAPALIALTIKVNVLMERAIAWMVRTLPRGFNPTLEAERFRPVAEALATGLSTLLSPGAEERHRARAGKLTSRGAPEDLALAYAQLPLLAAAPDIACIAEATIGDPNRVAEVYFAVGDRFGLNYLRDQAAAIETEEPWTLQAVDGLAEELMARQAALTQAVVQAAPGQQAGTAIEAWARDRGESVPRLLALVAELRALPSPVGLAPLSVASRRFAELLRDGA